MDLLLPVFLFFLPDPQQRLFTLDVNFGNVIYLIMCQCLDNGGFCDIFRFFFFCQINVLINLCLILGHEIEAMIHIQTYVSFGELMTTVVST